ncbi:IS6 family transposase [Brevundimonas sp. AAP58]|uniref:IS6 family transposase n=1 Tax=Brevundimonas sp. AAP58 TaxID=1523422 RepID=UPI000B2683CB
MAERGVEVSREAIWCWVIKCGPLIAANLHHNRPSPTGRGHLDEVVVRIGRRRMCLWRAVDDEGEVLDALVQKRRSKEAALKLLRPLLRKGGSHPQAIATDKLASYRAAMKVLNLQGRHRPGRMRDNNLAENSHFVIRRRDRKQQKFKSQGPAQRFLSSHGPIYNAFNLQPHLISRPDLRSLRRQANNAWAVVIRAA